MPVTGSRRHSVPERFVERLANEGKIKWKYEPRQDPSVIPVMCCDTVNRGVAYAPAEGDRPALIILLQADTTVVALNADTGAVADSVAGIETPANELVVVRNYSALAPHYGIPDIVPAMQTLFGDLDGYAKVAVSSNVFAGPAFGFDRYFDAFEFVSQSKRFPGLDLDGYVLEMGLTDPRLVPTYLLDACRSDHTIKSLLNAGVGGLNLLSSSSSLLPQLFDKGTTPVLRRSRKQIAASDEPFFAFCNVMEGHVPHTPVRGYDRQYYPDVPNGWSSDERDVWDLCESAPDEYWRRREQVYAAAIDYVDRKLTAYVERVEALTDRETVFVVTSDHGDNHGRPSEDGMANHVSSLSEALIHVPFEVVNPPAEVATALERVRERPTSHLQLRSVVAALAGGEGLSGTAELRVVPAELVGRAESSDPPSDEEYFDRAQRCCIRGREKVAWDSQRRAGSPSHVGSTRCRPGRPSSSR